MREIAKRSRACQKGAWGGGALLSALSVSLPLSFGILNATILLLFDRPQVSGALFSLWPRLPGIVSACLAFSMSMFALLALAPLHMGSRAWYYGGAVRPTRSRKWVTYWYRPSQAFRAAHISISLAARKTAWALLLLSPGVLLGAGVLLISSGEGLEARLLAVLLGGAVLLTLCGLFAWLWMIQRYALVRWIAARYPKAGVQKIFAAAVRRMEGRYGFSLGFGLRLLPLAPLALLILPLLWIVPYALQRRAVWAFSLVEDT